MDPASITPADLRLLLAFVAEAITRKEAELNALDAAIGDGDHGITMRVGFTAVNAKISGLPDVAGIDAILRESGMAFVGATGGAIGVLLGKMLMAAGAALKGRPEIGPSEFRILLEAMESTLVSTGKARPGDKTMLDAVHAANGAVKAENLSGEELVPMLEQAARAALMAAQDTAQMLPRTGRASRLGERALGHPDPGAVSFSVLLTAMAEWAQQTSRRGV